MFLMIGITDGEQDLHYHWHLRCGQCGAVKDLVFFMTFTQLLLFFLPTVKWNRHYYARCTTCGTVYELDPQIGRWIEHGETVEILPEYLTRISTGSGDPYEPYGNAGRRTKQCPNCGATTDSTYDYCPHCGTKLN